MAQLHERMLEAVFAERQRLLTRRGLLGGGAKLTAAGALGLAALSLPRMGTFSALAQDELDGDLEVLNYALTLEHLEYAFYRDGIGQFTFGLDPFGNDIGTFLAAIRDHEGAHVEALTQVVTDLGGEPVEEAEYDFGYTDAASFLTTAAALENTGVSAYDGAGQFLETPDLVTAAGGIVAVEARHAAYLNLVTGVIPFPASFEETRTPGEVLEIATPFIVS